MPGYGYVLALESLEDVKITGCVFDGVRAALKLGHVSRAYIGYNEFTNMGSDGVNMGDCHDIDIHENLFHRFNPTPLAHPDSVQCNTATDRYPRCSNITVRDNTITGMCQGMLIRDVDGVLVARNTIHNGEPTGIGVQNCTKAVIDSNTLRTMASVLYQSRIDTRETTDMTWLGSNTTAAHRNSKQVIYS